MSFRNPKPFLLSPPLLCAGYCIVKRMNVTFEKVISYSKVRTKYPKLAFLIITDIHSEASN